MRHVHRPILLEEAIQGLAIKPDGCYIDGTFGRGGHSLGILQRLGPHGRLIALDKDPEAIAEANRIGLSGDPRFKAEQKSFAELQQVAEQQNILGCVNGILLDLGVSSPQLETPERGFSFLREGPLDMRMNPLKGMDAATWINQEREEEIARVLWEYGEERFSRRIASTIVKARKQHRIETTTQLASVVARACPSRERKRHPATRTFQAIRIYVNNELEDLKACLSQTAAVLAVGGRLCVISFHSLEDRIVKQSIKGEMREHWRKINKLIRPTREEFKQNPRSRSAKMRIMEKIA